MAEASVIWENQFCTLCDEDSINNPAATWCPDCDTFLCCDCNRHHGRNKASKEHSTISLENYKELPTFITKTSMQCSEHKKRLELFCSFHQVASCIECITKDHNECKELRQLTDVLANFKTSSSVDNIEDNLQALRENFDKVIEYLSNRLLDTDTKITTGVEKIKEMRKSINTHLDKLEEKLLNDLALNLFEIKGKTEKLLAEIKSRKSDIDDLETDFYKMKQFANDLQMYIGIKKIEKLTNEQEKYLIDIQGQDLKEEESFEIKLSSKILELEKLGNVKNLSVPVTSLHLKLPLRQQTCQKEHTTIALSSIKPKLLRQIYFDRAVKITGCQMLPNGQMLFVDQQQKRLMLHNTDGSFVRNVVTFNSVPYDVTLIADKIIAVSTYDDNQVHLVDVVRNEIIKSTGIQHRCLGIDSDGGGIRISCGKEKCIISIDIEDQSELSSQRIESYSSDIVVFGESIYISEYDENRIKCFSKGGDSLWCHQLEEKTFPRGISVDKHGFVYVACQKSHNIIVISPDGKDTSILLKKGDGLTHPFAVNIDRKTSQLLIANRDNGIAYLFQL